MSACVCEGRRGAIIVTVPCCGVVQPPAACQQQPRPPPSQITNKQQHGKPLHSHLLHLSYDIIEPHSPLPALGAVGVDCVEVSELDLAEGLQKTNNKTVDIHYSSKPYVLNAAHNTIRQEREHARLPLTSPLANSSSPMMTRIGMPHSSA